MLLFLLACNGSDEPGFATTDDSTKPDDSIAPDDSTVPDDSATNDDSTKDDSATDDSATTPGVIAPATDGSFTVPFDVLVTGSGAPVLDTVGIEHDVGPVTLFGTKQSSVVWTEQEFAGTTLLFALSITPDGQAMNVTYFYCYSGTLGYVYVLGYSQPLAGAYTTGKCPQKNTPMDAGVTLPALTALPEPVAKGIAISGAKLSLEDGAGRAQLGGATYDFTPFATVDCSTCGTPGWYELHVLLHRAGEACYGVLYLFPDDPTQAQIAWTLCLPSLAQPDGTKGVSYDVTWTGSFPSDIAPVGPPYPWHPPPGRE
jgi:hypothetical protein